MKLYHEKGEFKAAVRAYVAMGGSRADQDTFRLDVIGAALFHGLRHSNFDAGERVTKATLGSIRPDTAHAFTACRAAWEANAKVNFTDATAATKAQELLQPVMDALRELRAEQDRGKEERKQAKDAAARADAIAALNGNVPSPYLLKGPEGTVELSKEEFQTLMSDLEQYRKNERPMLVDVRDRAEKLAAAA
jgi:hypothetical protein